MRKLHVRRWARLCQLAMFTGLATVGPQAMAATSTWVAGVGDWSNLNNWSPIGIPGATVTVTVANGGTPQINASAVARYLTVDYGSSVGLLTHSLSVSNNEYLGYNGAGNLLQTGGTNTVGNFLYVGYNASGLGTYTMSDAAVALTITNGGETVGNSATGTTSGGTITQYGGTFNQSAGTNTPGNLTIGNNSGSTGAYTLSGTGTINTGGLYLAYSSGSTGTFTLSAGSLSVAGANDDVVGCSGVGNFIQTGGTHTIPYSLCIGSSASAVGTYTMNNAAATLTATQGETVGDSATGISSGGTITQYGGTFNQSAGTNTCGGLTVGNYTGSTGSYALSGTGIINTASVYLGWDSGSTGIFTFSGGSLTVTGDPADYPGEYVGNGGTGNFTQTGGTNTTYALYIGYGASALGTYTMNNAAARLTATNEEIVGNNAPGTISGGTITQYGATFNQSAGTNTTPTLTIGYFSGTAIYILSGTGCLSVAGDELVGYNGATANFTQSGGTHTIGGTLTIGAEASTGTFNLQGGTLAAGAIVVDSGGAFNWTGGDLSVGTFGTSANPFNLSNTGTGILAPGLGGGAVGTTTIFGNYTQGTAATTAIRIAGVSPGAGNDLVSISGTAFFGGTLTLATINGFMPSIGQNFLIATYAWRIGTFAFVVPPQLPQDVAFQLDYTTNPAQLMIHMVAPVAENWTAAAGAFGTATNWDTQTAPGTTSSLIINNTGAGALAVTVSTSTTVHYISISGTSASAALQVPQGVELGVASQVVVGTNGVLNIGGQLFGNLTLNGGILGGYGTISGAVIAGTGAHTIAPSAGVPATSTGTLTLGSLATNANTSLAFNLVTPGTAGGSDQINIAALNGLTLNGGTIQVTNSAAGPDSLGYYKILQYTGSIGGEGVSSLVLPPVTGDIAYTLDTTHDPGFIDIHRGLLGDANDDGVVNGADFDVLASNFGKSGVGWSGGDFNGDGVVDYADFAILSNNFGDTIEAEDAASFAGGASGVPEPGSLLVLGAGLLGLARRRRM